jgi:hypothetical protein
MAATPALAYNCKLNRNFSAGIMADANAKPRFRFRLFVSATCATLCVLMVALWIRSYWKWEGSFLFIRSTAIGIESANGLFVPYYRSDLQFAEPQVFHYHTFPRPYERHHLPFSWQDWSGKYLYLPHWFVAHIFATGAILPWISWRKFSVKRLLLLTTYFAVLCGLIITSRRS